MCTPNVAERLEQSYSHHRVSKSRNRHFTAQKDTYVFIAGGGIHYAEERSR